MAIRRTFFMQREVGRVIRGVEGWVLGIEIRAGLVKWKGDGLKGGAEKVKQLLPEQMV
jgi:hypothetical protein